MATHTYTEEILIDDLDGSPGDRTIGFGWNGSTYEIELSKRNAGAFEKVMRPYLEAARREHSARTRRSSPGRRRRPDGERDLAAVRVWAADAGYVVSSRGRVAANVLEAYDSAHA